MADNMPKYPDASKLIPNVVADENVPPGAIIYLGKRPESWEYTTEDEFWKLWGRRSSVIKDLKMPEPDRG